MIGYDCIRFSTDEQAENEFSEIKLTLRNVVHEAVNAEIGWNKNRITKCPHAANTFSANTTSLKNGYWFSTTHPQTRRCFVDTTTIITLSRKL